MLEAFQPIRPKPARLPVGLMGAAKQPCLCAADAQGSTAIPCDLWEAEPDGTVAAEVGLFRLVVHPNTPSGHARFLVLQRLGSTASCRPALLASGHGENVEAAMLAAAQRASRLYS